MKILKGCAILTVSIFVGAAFFSAVRTMMYNAAGLQPNMGAEMFILFSPLLGAPIAIVAVIIHSWFAGFFRFSSGWQWAYAGASYSSILLGLISPGLLLIPLLANPITLKFLRTIKFKRRS